MRTYLLLLVVLLATNFTFAQSTRGAIGRTQTEKSRTTDKGYQAYQLFETISELPLGTEAISQELQTYDLMLLRSEDVNTLRNASPDSLTFALPRNSGETIQLELVRLDIFQEGAKIRMSNGEVKDLSDLGVYYQGIVADRPNSVVSISVFDDRVSGMISDPSLGNMQLDRVENALTTSSHVLYEQSALIGGGDTFSCQTPDEGPDYNVLDLVETAQLGLNDKCVGIYFEVDYDIYQDKGGTDGVTNYITGLFNQVATLYSNENINVKISELFIWNSPSPYTGTTSSAMLNQFQSVRSSFNGDLAQLLSYRASGGIAVVNGLCRSSTSLKMSFSSIGSNYNTFPNYSFTVMVVAHELGHLLGSYHTHACAWNGNNTAIDGCPGFTEGNCAVPSAPSGGGTVMSYCHLNATGINFSRGFGPQPGNVMRSRVAAASCLQTCSAPPPSPDCNDEEVTVSITLDNYGSEVTWQFTDAAGNVLQQGGPYADGALGSTVTDAICVPEGCYSFTIFDAYGDGICCAYGSGSYRVTDKNGNILASGGSYGTSEKKDFCLGTVEPSECDGEIYTMALTLDNFGSEVSWEVVGSNGQTLYEGGPYQDKTGGSVIRDTFCLPQGCSTFRLLDDYGDGICCQYGNGAIQIKNNQGAVILNGGSFDSVLEREICADDPGNPGGGGNCTALDFNQYPVISFGGAQDKGTFQLNNGGQELELNGNSWKAIDLEYEITATTVVEFDFRSTREGEIQGLGFDTDNSISSSFAFKVFGTQNWGISQFDDYSGNGEWKSYRIPVGQFYTGTSSKFFFMCDHDGGAQNANAFFRNVRIHEGTDCLEELSATPIAPQVKTIVETPYNEQLLVYPNPTSGLLNIQFNNKVEGTAVLEVFDLKGKRLLNTAINTSEGINRQQLSLTDLLSGMYILKISSPDMQLVERFQLIK